MHTQRRKSHEGEDERTLKCFAVEPGSKGLLLNSFNFIFFSRSPGVLFLESGREGEAFFNTQFHFMTLEIYKGDMCHSVMEDAPKIFKIQNDKHFCTPAEPVPPEDNPSALTSRENTMYIFINLINYRRSACLPTDPTHPKVIRPITGHTAGETRCIFTNLRNCLHVHVIRMNFGVSIQIGVERIHGPLFTYALSNSNLW